MSFTMPYRISTGHWSAWAVADTERNLGDHDSWLNDAAPDEMRRIVDALYRVHRLVSVITDLDSLLVTIMEESKDLASAEACSLMLYDEQSEELYFRVALGETGDQQALKKRVRLKLGQGIAGVAAIQRESVMVDDARKDPRFFSAADKLAQFETRSLLAVPMVDREELVGVVEVVNKREGAAFTQIDRHTMEIFASLVATVITSARLIEQNVRSERLAATGQAVAGLSHYTKNIIAGMQGSVELIDLGLERGKFEVQKKGWDILKRSIDRIAMVVEDMLTYSKPREPVRQPCSIADLLADAVRSFESTLAQKGTLIEVDSSTIDVPFSVDAVAIYRCLLNLLSNAADAVPAEGGLIHVRATILKNSEKSGGAPAAVLHIEVGDNGPGVPEEDVRDVFDPFFSTKGSGGTGLGLAVTRKVITEHGGTITVSGNPGGGALFKISIPDGETPE